MTIQFSKYQGAGNDFILIDNRNLILNNPSKAMIAKICDRRFGIGGDGVMLLQKKEGFDFEMLYFNANGNPGSMCGNGGRCIVAFARDLGMIQDETNFLAVDGPHYAKISDKSSWISLQMIDVDLIKKDGEAFVLNTGSPHYVTYTSKLKEKDVFTEGKKIRNRPEYITEGINVNFVEDLGDYYFVRTYERGVEDETFACGTGVTAVAMAMTKQKKQIGKVTTSIKVLGGKLRVSFYYDGETFSHVFLEGPAEFVFKGEMEIIQ